MRRLVLGAAILATCAGLALAADAVRIAGKVKDVAKDGASFAVQDKAGLWEVAIDDEKTEIVVHKATPLRDCPSVETAVLARRDEGSGPSSAAPQGTPPQIVNVLAVVVGEGFKTPDVTPDQRAKGLTWIRGTLKHYEKTGGSALDGTSLQWGPDRPAIELTRGEKSAIAKGKLVLVEGTSDAKLKAAATRVSVLSPGIPAAEYKLAFGL